MVRDSLQKYYDNTTASSVLKITKLRKIDFSRRYGMYEIPEGSNAIAIARKIGAGGQKPVKITVNGFRDIDLLTERISRKLDFSAQELKDALNNPDILKPYGLKPEQALALFVDDSYEVYWTSSPEDIIRKVGENYTSLWDATRKEKASRLGLTPPEVMTIASIADEETNNDPEKGAIARLYVNRLKMGMKLQSDPTVRFALKDFTIRRVKGEHLKVNSPYNTYLNSGLPPGPIRTTSKRTVDALLDSQPHNYLFMCAKEDFSGTHNFAETFSEHSRNASRYQKALNERGIH